MTTFKPGDRIHVYGFDSEDASKVLTRKVVSIGLNGLLETDAGEYVHPRQCRKLVKKPRREWWLSLYDDGSGSAFPTLSDAKEDFRTSIVAKHKIIRVREVKQK